MLLSLNMLTLVEALEDKEIHIRENKHVLPHGTMITLEFVWPLLDMKRRVFGDSYFVSVKTVHKFAYDGLYFIGVIKTATLELHITYLRDEFECSEKGQFGSLVHKG